MKIEKIIIKNFRIFNGVYTFDFRNRDIVIIKGPNGNGKSTIFDSIQWCLTGEIPRYKGDGEWRQFNYLMNENIFKTEDKECMFVEVWFRTNQGDIHTIKRSVEKDSGGDFKTAKIIINSKSFTISKGTKKIRDILTKEGLEKKRSGKKNEISLPEFFSSTQVLSQDALHNFIRADKPAERYKVINGILGIGKYGEDFEKFIELAKKVAEDRKTELLVALEKPRINLEKLTAQIVEREELRLGIGENSEQELIISIEKLLEKIKQLEIIKIEIPNRILSVEKGIQEELIQIKLDVAQNKENQEEIKIDLENSRELFLLTPQVYTDKKSNLIYQQKMLQDKMIRRESGIGIVGKRKLELNTLKIKRKKYQKEKEHYKVLKTKIAENHLAIRNILSHKEVVESINEFGSKQAFIDIYERYLQEKDIIKKAQRCIQIDLNLEEIKRTCAIQSKNAEKYGQQLKEVEEKLRIVSNMISKLENEVLEKKSSTLEELVRQVQGHVLEHKAETICPVCGIDHDTNERFKTAITRKINVFNENLSELEKKLFEMKATKSKYKEEIRVIKLKQEKEETQIFESEKSEEVLRLEKESLVTEVPNVNVYLANKELTDVNTIYKQTENFLSNYQLPFGMLKSLIEKIDITSEIESALFSQERVLDEIRGEAQSWEIYLDLEEKVIDRKIERIDNYNVKVKEESIRLNQKKLELNKEIIQLNETWEKRERKISGFQQEDGSFTGEMEKLDMIKEKINERIEILTKIESELRAQLAKVYSFLQDGQIKELKKQQGNIKAEVKEKEKAFQRYESFLNKELAGLKESHKLVNSELISEYLSQHSDYINQIFMQISPHAVYRYVQLVPKENNLYVVMTKNREEANKLKELGEQEWRQQFSASLTFSSGQSNVLALCIFLALNRSQKWTRLKFLGIDDPFQNLDDINIFSFIDVISQIVSLQRKQLLISTHNEDFANLIRVKMGLNPERIGEIIFHAYNDEGASVKGNCVVEGEEGISVN